MQGKRTLVRLAPRRNRRVALMAISGGDAVLVHQPAEPVGPLDPSQDDEPLQSRIGDRGAEIGTSMWSLVVVMLDEVPQYPFQVALAPNEQPVEALGPRCSHEPFGEGVREATAQVP